MTDKTFLTHMDILELAYTQARKIKEDFDNRGNIYGYPIPRGGVAAAYAIKSHLPLMKLVSDPKDADFFLDDIVDTGRTAKQYFDRYGNATYALINKLESKHANIGWVVFPWEGTIESSIDDNIVRLLQFIGEDPTRGGLLDTPKRVAKAWTDWSSGYKQDPKSVMKCFEDGANGVDEMVVVSDIPFYSHCEHHLAPFFGSITIGYIPDKRILGLSKLARLTDIYAKRLQVQERLTNQIADSLEEGLSPIGIGVVVKARHLCMESRGVAKQGHMTITSALRGVIKSKPEARAEFLDLAR